MPIPKGSSGSRIPCLSTSSDTSFFGVVGGKIRQAILEFTVLTLAGIGKLVISIKMYWISPI